MTKPSTRVSAPEADDDPPAHVGGGGEARADGDHPAGGERPQHGHAEGDADLAAGGGHGGRDARLRRRHSGDGRVGDRRVDQSVARAEENVGDDEHGEGGARRQLGEDEPADQDGEAAAHQRPARPEGAHGTPAQRRDDHHHSGHRQGVEPGLQWRQAADVLEVEGVEEEEAADRHEQRDRDGGGAREGRAAEEAHLQQRLATAQLVGHQTGEGAERDDEEHDRLRREPPGLGALDDRVGERGQRHDDQHLPHRVHAPRVGSPGLGDEQRGEDDGDDPDGDVDDEH